MISLEEVLQDIYSGGRRQHIILVGDSAATRLVHEATDDFFQHEGLSEPGQIAPIEHFPSIRKINGDRRDRAGIILEVSFADGGLRISLNKHRFHCLTTYSCSISPFSYEECFRILKDAKKDKIILDWELLGGGGDGNPSSSILSATKTIKRHSPPPSYGGDPILAALNSAVAFVFELRQAPKEVERMGIMELDAEIKKAGYVVQSDNGVLPVWGLFPNCAITPSLSSKVEQSQLSFYQDCVKYIRSRKM